MDNGTLAVIVLVVCALVVYRIRKHKLHREVVSLINKWNPKKLGTEKEYENSLYKYLHARLDEQVTQQPSLGRIRADIVVEDQKKGDKVLIELKHNLHTTSQLQRLKGQLQDYTEKWNGTLILLLCGNTEPNIRKDFEPSIKKLGKKKKLDVLYKK